MAPSNWKKENVTPSFKEEDVGKLHTGQPYLNLQEYYGEILTTMSTLFVRQEVVWE